MHQHRRVSGISRHWLAGLTSALVIASALQGGARASTASADQPAGINKINHVIVIYEENHSFDNLYGQFPGANGLSNATSSQATQVSKAGDLLATLPAALSAPVDLVRSADPRFPADMPNKPFLLNDFVSPADKTGDMIHAYYREQYQIDGGKMDKFASWTDGGGLVMGYWDASGLPLYELSKQYTVMDNFFHAAFGGSFLNHFWLVCACTPRWSESPADMVAIPFADDPDHLQDKNITTDGFVVNTSFTVNTPHPAITAPDHLIPNQTMPTIGDRLTNASVSWAWYAGGWNDAIAGKPDPLFQYHHHPFAYFANFADGTLAKAEHLQDETDFERALTTQALPSVSFVKPMGPDNEHPGYANISQGEDHAVKLIQEIQASPYWQDSVIIVTYDEHGGSWDHVAPPTIDKWGPGLRVPTIVISPFAKKGFVDHAQYDTTAILKLIETRWGLQPLGTRDADAGNMLTALNLD